MRISEATDDSSALRLSATDLSNHLHCHHLTQLNLAVARGERDKPDWYDPRADVLRERGYEHEERYLEHLKAQGRTVVDIPAGSAASQIERTIDAMRDGAEVIAQGALEHDGWFGRPDVLLKVEAPSKLGEWSYEVLDTKLARETKGATVLQLCLYSELVEAVQGRLPERMHVVSPGEELAPGLRPPETLRVAEYLAYHRWVKARLLEVVGGEPEGLATYPEPVEHCQVCAFWSECDTRRHDDDHLSLVAGAGRGQRRELEGRGIGTLARLAREPVPLGWKPERGSRPTYERLREQARVQLEGRRREAPYWELLPLEPERGLARLPEPDAADVFFDFEGDAFVGTAGLEYVFGWVTANAGRGPEFEHYWVTDAEEEKAAFEAFVTSMRARLDAHPGFHIYHFTPYEPATLKRLMGRYAVCEAQLDDLLRGGVFVDLHAVARQALLAAVESYSLKELEGPYAGFERALPLEQARRARYRVERMLELGRPDAITVADRDDVLEYNKEDCLATLALRDWLEGLRAEQEAAGAEIARPLPETPGASEKVTEHQQRVEALMARLTAGVPADEAERSPEEHGRWLLAHLADYHRREQKVSWWEWFRLAGLDAGELLDETVGIAGLACVAEVPPEEGSRRTVPVHRYAFPHQEVKLKLGQDVYMGEQKIGSLEAFDLQGRTLDVKKTKKTADLHPPAVFLHTDINPRPKDETLLSFAEAAAKHGLELTGAGRLACDLVMRRPPRLAAGGGPVGPALGETDLEAARRMAVALEGGVLPVQGPPGSGKTYTGARMALELVRRGKRVGLSATGHTVMRNFLREAVRAAEEEGVDLRCCHRPKQPYEERGIVGKRDYKWIRPALDEGEIQILAGTGWLWAREDFEQAVDVLFIDEAGQMALADVLACTRGARALVLLGDPQQLDQPQRGSHPEGTHVSALEHLLAGARTLREDAGLFLKKTYRLHPTLCRFTSELFYEDRLSPVPGLENQLLAGPVLEGAGLWFLPVEHDGNQSSSPEEVEAVGRLVESLVDPTPAHTTTWTDQHGATRPLRLDDILIVAPYNAQVQALKERLPEARIGTVDKFQGQQAPIVVFSTATSSPDLAPRGMEFLYDASRLNVATSRAKSACVFVGSPTIFEPECRTPRQIKLANAFCRYREVARELPLLP